MNHANPGTGQHGDGQLGNHAHVDGDAIPLAEPLILEDVCKFAHLPMQLPVGEFFHIRIGVTLPEDGGFVGGRRAEVTVQTVAGDVEFAIGKPGVFDLTGLGVPSILERLTGLLEPGQAFRLLQPEFVGVLK